jgi:hypothetical protein
MSTKSRFLKRLRRHIRAAQPFIYGGIGDFPDKPHLRCVVARFYVWQDLLTLFITYRANGDTTANCGFGGTIACRRWRRYAHPMEAIEWVTYLKITQTQTPPLEP